MEYLTRGSNSIHEGPDLQRMNKQLLPRVDLQSLLVRTFTSWQPVAPEVVARSKSSVTLKWDQLEPFQFLAEQLLFQVQMKSKVPPWILVYSGGRTSKSVENLAACRPYQFRLRVVLKSRAAPGLADRALQHFRDHNQVYQIFTEILENNTKSSKNSESSLETGFVEPNNTRDGAKQQPDHHESNTSAESRRWVESRWSELTWGSTESAGSSAACFGMAVRCGYLKQLQSMLEERPDLIDIMNPNNGFTPLATAVRKGDINTVRFVLAAGAEVDQRSGSGQTALHLAILGGDTDIIDLLLDKGADLLARDLCGLCGAHYAVDGGGASVLRQVLDRGPPSLLAATDSNGWTPVFRAVCQGASTEVIRELKVRGSDVTVTDHAGLTLVSAAKLLGSQGQPRGSVLSLVDPQYPHDKALTIFTRLTKKISNVHFLRK